MILREQNFVTRSKLAFDPFLRIDWKWYHVVRSVMDFFLIFLKRINFKWIKLEIKYVRQLIGRKGSKPIFNFASNGSIIFFFILIHFNILASCTDENTWVNQNQIANIWKWIKIKIQFTFHFYENLIIFVKMVLFIKNLNQKWILPQDYTLKRKQAPCFKLNELLEHLEHFDNFEYFRILLRTWFWFRSMTVKIFNW